MKPVRLLLASGLALCLLAQAQPSATPAVKTSVAVYQIKPAGVEPSLAAAMTSLLVTRLTPSPQLRVIEEAMLKTVMERQGMNASDSCDDTSCQVEIGKLVKAQKLVIGDLTKFGSKYILALKLVDIQTGVTDFTTEDSCTCTEDQLPDLVTAVAARLRNHFGESVPVPSLPNPAASSRPPAPASGPAPAPDASAIDQAKSFGDKSFDYFKKGDYDLALQFLTRAIELNPHQSDFFVGRCGIYQKKGNLDAAIQDCSRAIEIDPENAISYCVRGECYMGKGNLDLALQDFNRSLSIKADSARAYYYRGTLYLQKGQYDLAIQDGTSAINCDSNANYPYLVRGDAYSMKGNYDLAIKDYNHAIKLNPKESSSYQRRGRAYRMNGDYKEAISDFNRALELDPKNASAYGGLAKVYATATADKFRNGPKAVELATKACEMTEWKDPDSVATLAAAYAEVGDFPKTIQYQEKAIGLAGNNEEIKKKFQAGLELYQQKKPFRGEIR